MSEQENEKIAFEIIEAIKKSDKTSIPTYASELGVDRSTLGKFLKKFANSEYQKIKHKNKTQKLSYEDIATICDEYQTGSTLAELAEEYCVSIRTIEKTLIKNNIPRRRVGRPEGTSYYHDHYVASHSGANAPEWLKILNKLSTVN